MQIVPWTADLVSKLTPMFSGDRPIPIRMWAILDGAIAGRIVVDQLEQPSLALVQELAEGTTYIAGTPTPQSLLEALALVHAAQEAVVCVWDDDPLRLMLPDSPAYDGVAIDFTDRSPAVDLGLLGSIPDGYQLRAIDRDIVPALEGFDYYVDMFGGLEQALDRTIGYCLLHGDTVACEAVAGPIARGVAELGIGTAEAYRRRGLGTITAARVIQECEAHGYQPFWNASQQNEPSIALARRLGFQTERPFRVLAWDSLT